MRGGHVSQPKIKPGHRAALKIGFGGNLLEDTAQSAIISPTEV